MPFRRNVPSGFLGTALVDNPDLYYFSMHDCGAAR